MGQHDVFVPDKEALEKRLRLIKRTACPFCQAVGTLNRHSLIEGNDPGKINDTHPKGQRVLCSARGRRGGCGHTFAVLLAWVLPRHTFTAPLLWNGLTGWLNGRSIRASWLNSKGSLALDSFYHLLQRFRRRSSWLRPILCQRGNAPPGSNPDPLRQTFQHLRCAFPSDSCPPQAFQLAVQRSLVG